MVIEGAGVRRGPPLLIGGIITGDRQDQPDHCSQLCTCGHELYAGHQPITISIVLSELEPGSNSIFFLCTFNPFNTFLMESMYLGISVGRIGVL